MKHLAALAVIAAAACAGSSDASSGPDATPVDPADAGPIQPFRACTGRAFTPAPSQEWRHDIRTPIVTATGDANHSSQDQIDPTGATVTLHGKFAYGLASVDLEDELVRVWIDDCAGWRALGDVATDDDGRIALPAPASVFAGPGVHEVRFEVLGDRSMTSSFVWVLPRGTRIAVADLDGTLTTSDTELFEQILDGDEVPDANPGAVALTTAHAAQGEIVMYLSGRPYWLAQRTRDWLSELGFAPGPLHLADTTEDSLPTQGSVGEFKRRFLTHLVDAGYVIDAAYGNTSTDVFAYLGAGIPADRVWIIGATGGTQGTHAVTGGWSARADEILASPPVDQPFTR